LSIFYNTGHWLTKARKLRLSASEKMEQNKLERLSLPKFVFASLLLAGGATTMPKRWALTNVIVIKILNY
jgi:hypothetical protein